MNYYYTQFNNLHLFITLPPLFIIPSFIKLPRPQNLIRESFIPPHLTRNRSKTPMNPSIINLHSPCLINSILLLSLCISTTIVELVFAQINPNQIQSKNYYITWDDIKVDREFEDLVDRYELSNGNSHDHQPQQRSNKRRSIIVVDQNGKGDSITVQGAVNLVPDGNSQRVKIFILPGIYREKVIVPSTKPYISFIGKQNQTSNTVITWNNKASDRDSNGDELGTYGSATVTIFSDYFCASEITIQNTIVAKAGGYGMQAVALRVSADKSMLYKVNLLGAQDTLLDDTGSHYFYQCFIQGSVDFIFGNARSLYQDCVLHSIADRAGAIAAHHRNTPYEDTGFSFLNCTINGSGKIYLGRAWGPFSRVIYSYCDIDDIIIPEGWSDWGDLSRRRTTVFGEYRCRGKGAYTRRRVPWMKIFGYGEVKRFLDMNFIDGNKWLRLY